jgi:tol-pal system protein YbgF
MRQTSIALLTVLLVSASTPAWAGPSKEYLQLMAEVRMLEEQNQQLQQLFGSLQDALKAVTAKLDDQAASNRKAMADQTLAVNNLGETVRVLREKADDTTVRISTVATEIQSLRQMLASQPPPQGAVPVPSSPAGGDTTVPGGAPPATSNPSADPGLIGVSPQRMFDSAYSDFSSGRYDSAISGFELFIKTFPKLPQAAEAQFNIGASYFNQSKWNEARDAFLLVTQNYPQATDANASAYFKLGATYEALKQVDSAKKAYEAVVQKYPSSFQATQASQALQRLNRR